MRLVVTGRFGQVASALKAATLPPGVEVVALGRPELDLDRPETVGAAIAAARPDVVISAAAWTGVDAAEGAREAVFRANADSPRELAAAARRLGAPVLHLSTDYVFDGSKASPYAEVDPTGPRSVYGASKLAGEEAVLDAQPESLVLRTAWVHAAAGSNFVATMLRLAEARDAVRVVADQQGSPTYAPDVAEALLALATRASARDGPFGVHHMTAAGATTWATFAEAIFDGSASRGGPSARVEPIATADYPTAAARPANSRLNCGRLARDWGVALPDWRNGLERHLDARLGPVRAGKQGVRA